MSITRERIEDIDEKKRKIKMLLGKIFIAEKMYMEEVNYTLETILVEHYATCKLSKKEMKKRLDFMKVAFDYLDNSV